MSSRCLVSITAGVPTSRDAITRTNEQLSMQDGCKDATNQLCYTLPSFHPSNSYIDIEVYSTAVGRTAPQSKILFHSILFNSN